MRRPAARRRPRAAQPGRPRVRASTMSPAAPGGRLARGWWSSADGHSEPPPDLPRAAASTFPWGQSAAATSPASPALARIRSRLARSVRPPLAVQAIEHEQGHAGAGHAAGDGRGQRLGDQRLDVVEALVGGRARMTAPGTPRAQWAQATAAASAAVDGPRPGSAAGGVERGLVGAPAGRARPGSRALAGGEDVEQRRPHAPGHAARASSAGRPVPPAGGKPPVHAAGPQSPRPARRPASGGPHPPTVVAPTAPCAARAARSRGPTGRGSRPRSSSARPAPPAPCRRDGHGGRHGPASRTRASAAVRPRAVARKPCATSVVSGATTGRRRAPRPPPPRRRAGRSRRPAQSTPLRGSSQAPWCHGRAIGGVAPGLPRPSRRRHGEAPRHSTAPPSERRSLLGVADQEPGRERIPAPVDRRPRPQAQARPVAPSRRPGTRAAPFSTSHGAGGGAPAPRARTVGEPRPGRSPRARDRRSRPKAAMSLEVDAHPRAGEARAAALHRAVDGQRIRL
jgi:hypothetical protein